MVIYMKKIISTDKAPAAIGPYSQAIEVNGMVYTSGIIPVVPETGEIPEGSVAQAKQALTNLSNLLEAAGTSMANVVKTTHGPLDSHLRRAGRHTDGRRLSHGERNASQDHGNLQP